MKTYYRKGQRFGNWQLTEFLGGGGNGEVWKCTGKEGQYQAIKLLKKIRPKAYLRFKDEMAALDECKDIVGILGISDRHLPIDPNSEAPFYIMPLAKPAETFLFSETIEKKIDAIIQVAETVAKVHERRIYHRDIKPGNILFHNDRFCLADFGLVDYPNKKDISTFNEEIGPKWTMAPEMRRQSSTADPAKADIYSLAKTLWIFLTAQSKGFDGQYSKNSINDLGLFLRECYTSPLNDLMIKCTDNDPEKRPQLSQFINGLYSWKEVSVNFHKRNQEEWYEALKGLFPSGFPSTVEWVDKKDIVDVLNHLASFKSLNHTFFPDGGGLDLLGAKIANEADCIELDFGRIEILKPKRLLFESFGYSPIWNYFRLELQELKPVVNIEMEPNFSTFQSEIGREDVAELSPGKYYSESILEVEPRRSPFNITSKSRRVSRRLRGSFVIFCKRSVYNLISDTYDARHNKMDAETFRQYIGDVVHHIKTRDEENKIFENPLEDVKTRRDASKKREQDYIEEETVYRCGYCGSIVSEDGKELSTEDREYCIKVIEIYGDGIVERTQGECCRKKY